MSRTKKKEYSGSKRFDVTCRNHGSCPYCRQNREINKKRLFEKSVYDINEENYVYS